MATSTDMAFAKHAYTAFLTALDERGWSYNRNDDELRIEIGVTGEDLPMDLIMRIDTKYQIIRLQSLIPFKMQDDKIMYGSIATNHINYLLAAGSFDYDIGDGTIAFRLVQSFRNTYISSEICSYMIDVSCLTIDKYNDMLFMLGKGHMELSEFIKKINS